MEEPMSLQQELRCAIERIQKMEQYLDEVLDAKNVDANQISQDAKVREMIQKLSDYYECGQWLEDYERDERGELPTDLKRGVLSQDTLYDLLCEFT